MTVFLPEFSGVIIGTTCLLQMLIAVMLDRHYGHQLLRYYLWVVWYPFGFWLINMLTIVVAIPKILFRGRDLRARWISPDRGIHENDHQPPSQSNRQTDPAAKNDHDDDRHSPQNAGVQTQYLSGENLILDHFCQQSLAYRWFTNCLTAMAWGFWLYLWLPIIDSFGHLLAGITLSPQKTLAR